MFDSKKKHKNPLADKGFDEKSKIISSIHKKSNMLCLSLDKNLIAILKKKPPKNVKSSKVSFINIDGKSLEKHIIVRPYVSQFLEIVS